MSVLWLATERLAFAEESSPVTEAEALHAFAQLYGIVRWYHPSDEGAAADWSALAVDGVRRVREVNDRDALAETLEEVFASVAPTLDVYADGLAGRALEWPKGPVVAWQHEGGGEGSIYRSHRTQRASELPLGPSRAVLSTTLDATALRGKTVRLVGSARLEEEAEGESVMLGVRVDRQGGERGFSDSMQERPIRSASWVEATIEGPVADDANEVALGALVNGRAGWFRGLSLSVRGEDGTWSPVPLGEWSTDTPSWSLQKEGDDWRLWRQSETTRRDLFPERPALGELWVAPIGAGLTCQVPLALPLRHKATWPKATHAPPPTTRAGAQDASVRLAAVIVAWNAASHFYPYFQEISALGVDWDRTLDLALADASDDTSADDLEVTLKRLIAQLHDGHGRVIGPVPRKQIVPVRLIELQQRVFVEAADESSGLLRGDELLSIDGRPIAEPMAEASLRRSGSPQWISNRLFAWAEITAGAAGTSVALEVMRGGTTLEVTAERTTKQPPPAHDRPPMEEIEGGVWYVDLARATWPQIEEKLEVIAAAPGVIFDLRGYPNNNHQVLEHLISERDRSKWMFVSEMVRPHEGQSPGEGGFGWQMRPRSPHISGRVAFLTGGGAISYAESVMGLVEHHKLGEIVGAPTAGANGNITFFRLPGDFEIVFTGMRVLRGDGSQHHLVGIQPTVPVQPTISGVTEGRDEVFERALALVRGEGAP